MRIMVTGAGGFIGSHVVRACLERGHRVLAAVREGGSLPRLRATADEIDVAAMDLEDSDAVSRVLARFEPDAAVHTAWYARPGDYLDAAQNLRSLAMTVSFLETAFSAGCPKVVGVGTCLEYAEAGAPRAESDSTDPVSLYASCKVAAWLVGRAQATQNGKTFVWARLFHVYGPGEHPDRLIPAVVGTLRRGRQFLASPGLQVRDPIHVADVASALACLAEHGESGIYNVCVGRPVTLRETLETVAALEGAEGLLQLGARPYAEGELMYLVGDAKKLKALEWQPRFAELRAGLQDTLRAAGQVA